MGFSDKDRILMDNLYVLKGYKEKKLIKLRNFQINIGTAGTEQTYKQAARNWHDGKTKRQH